MRWSVVQGIVTLSCKRRRKEKKHKKEKAKISKNHTNTSNKAYIQLTRGHKTQVDHHDKQA